MPTRPRSPRGSTVATRRLGLPSRRPVQVVGSVMPPRQRHKSWDVVVQRRSLTGRNRAGLRPVRSRNGDADPRGARNRAVDRPRAGRRRSRDRRPDLRAGRRAGADAGHRTLPRRRGTRMVFAAASCSAPTAAAGSPDALRAASPAPWSRTRSARCWSCTGPPRRRHPTDLCRNTLTASCQPRPSCPRTRRLTWCASGMRIERTARE